ncbi:uncharacterized protein LOC124487904 isoform X2 [Hypomesus transpacificus]|uniref:uncharacterized protein LOC124487904 isoform X2 n=1 Tax=Hypomesus transpacificus TaxID=137520 RepID=UPI001F07204A|nr:uncharacterized protein LOC124487904 isoform X2 [Hypomesus transpacificus]
MWTHRQCLQTGLISKNDVGAEFCDILQPCQLVVGGVKYSSKEPDTEEEVNTIDYEEPVCGTEEWTRIPQKPRPQPGENVKITNQSLELDRATVPQSVKPRLLPPISRPSLIRSTHSDSLAPGSPAHTTTLPLISVSKQDALIKPHTKTGSEHKTALPSIKLQDTSPLTMSWMEGHRQRSPQFCLPEISVSSIESLLQQVTERLRRKDRESDNGGRLAYPAHLMTSNLLYLRDKRKPPRGNYRSQGKGRCPPPEVKLKESSETAEQKLPVILSMTKGTYCHQSHS